MSEITFPLVGYVLLFVLIGVGFILVHLLLGKLIRPLRPHSEKATIYECGEPTVGSAWVQFDLRYYVVALLFVIFDVEVAFFFPWAVVFGTANSVAQQQGPLTEEQKPAYVEKIKALSVMPVPEAKDPHPKMTEPSTSDDTVTRNAGEASTLAWVAFFDILVFFGVLLVGFAYLWKRGDLAWVRSVAAEQPAAGMVEEVTLPVEKEAVLTGTAS